MPQLQQTVLKDRSETPERTFHPSDIREGVAFLSESADVPMFAPELSVSLRRPTNQRKSYKGLVKLSLPVTEECSTTCTTRLKHVIHVSAEFTFPETSSQEERNNAVGLLASALEADVAIINDTLVNLEGIY